MDRQRDDSGPKTTNDIVKEQAGKAIGERHPLRGGKGEKTEGSVRGGSGDPLDAVREVVEEEKK